MSNMLQLFRVIYVHATFSAILRMLWIALSCF
uniref:Uncharacterized protein n=1 Tax=Arundo donax TaxID=35708 RepID=A0A0A9CIS7_ARUDO